jgi:hypothetical protein
MKKILFLPFLLITMSLAAQSNKDIVLKTKVSDVTIFLKGAQVLRKTTASIPAGRSTLRFTNLSPYIDAKSVQVRLNEHITVLSVNNLLNYNDTINNDQELEALRLQVKNLTESIRTEQTNKAINEQSLQLLNTNKAIVGRDGIAFANLKQTLEYYNTQIAALNIKALDLDRKIQSLQDAAQSIQREIAQKGGVKPEPSGEVVLEIETKTAAQVPVELAYYVANVSWFPTYDIRAASITEPIALSYKANILQNTKEDWQNVHLTVSSGNPNLGSVTPKLKTYLLDYFTPAPHYYAADDNSNQAYGRVTDRFGTPLIGATAVFQGTTIGTVTDAEGNFSVSIPANMQFMVFSSVGYENKTLPVSRSFMNVVLEDRERQLKEVSVVAYETQAAPSKSRAFAMPSMSSADIAPPTHQLASAALPVAQNETVTQMEFDIKIPYTIPSGSKTTVVEMQRYEMPAHYEYYAVPKIDKDAFLLAYISDWEQYSLIAGEANIFFENTFVGKTILDTRALGDTLRISLGRDKNILIQRDKVKENNTRKFLSSKTETTRDWKITVRNNKRQPVSLLLFDQIPVSTNGEIEVSTDQLSAGELNKETGEVKWKLPLQSAQQQILELIYRVRYPKGKTLNVE